MSDTPGNALAVRARPESRTAARLLDWMSEIESPPDDASPLQLGIASMIALLRAPLREIAAELPPGTLEEVLAETCREVASMADLEGARLLVVAVPDGGDDETVVAAIDAALAAPVRGLWKGSEAPDLIEAPSDGEGGGVSVEIVTVQSEYEPTRWEWRVGDEAGVSDTEDGAKREAAAALRRLDVIDTAGE